MSEAEILPSDIYLQRDLSLHSGEYYLIHAPSGKGKSSLLNFIYGINLQYDGEITIDHLAADFSLRISGISYLFQDLRLFPELTAMENILLKNQLTDFKNIPEIEDLLFRFSLLPKRNEPVQNLSLGQRQRIALIRALCQPFRFILLDEPFSHIDLKNKEIATEIILQEVEKQQAGIILTSLQDHCPFPNMHILKL